MKNLIGVMVVLFASVVFGQQMNDKMKDHQRPRDMKMNLKQQLNLSAEQEKKIDELRSSLVEKMIKLNADLDLKELEMKKLSSSENLTRSDMIKLTNDIGVIKNNIALARVNHQMDVYEILDNTQRKIWMEKQEMFGGIKDKMKNKMKDKMRGRRN